MPRIPELLTALRRRLLIHRRGLAALCVAVTVWSLTQALTADPPATVPGWTAVRDLTSGTVLRAADFRRTGFLPGTLPDDAAAGVSALVGRTLVVPLGRGEVATTGAVLGRSRLAGYPGRSAVAVRIPDPDAVALLHSGDRVGLIASDPQGTKQPARVTDGATVLAVPSTTSTGAGLPGRLVVLAVPDQDATAVSMAAASLNLTIVWSA